MGAEEFEQPSAVKRIHDEHVCRGGLCVVHGDDLGSPLELEERVGKPEGTARDAGATLVRLKLTRAGDGHLYEHGGDGRHDHHDQCNDRAAAFVVAVPEAFKQAQIDRLATFNFTPLLAVSLVFLLVTIPCTRLTDYLVERERRRRQSSVGV